MTVPQSIPLKVISVRIEFIGTVKDRVFEYPVFTQITGGVYRVGIEDKDDKNKVRLYSFPVERIKEIVEELQKPPEPVVMAPPPGFVPPINPN